MGRRKEIPYNCNLYCQCSDCLEQLELEAVVVDNKVVAIEPHNRVRIVDGDLRHKCGGEEDKDGELRAFLQHKWEV